MLVDESMKALQMSQLIIDSFNEQEPNRSVNSGDTVAYGAAVQAAILTGQGNEQVQDLLLLNLTPLSTLLRLPVV
jgi:L1 cell adhesion molecule like protein